MRQNYLDAFAMLEPNHLTRNPNKSMNNVKSIVPIKCTDATNIRSSPRKSAFLPIEFTSNEYWAAMYQFIKL